MALSRKEETAVNGWLLFWKAVIIATVLAFFSLAAVVTVLGVRDIQQLLRDLRKEDEANEKGLRTDSTDSTYPT